MKSQKRQKRSTLRARRRSSFEGTLSFRPRSSTEWTKTGRLYTMIWVAYLPLTRKHNTITTRRYWQVVNKKNLCIQSLISFISCIEMHLFFLLFSCMCFVRNETDWPHQWTCSSAWRPYTGWEIWLTCSYSSCLPLVWRKAISPGVKQYISVKCIRGSCIWIFQG